MKDQSLRLMRNTYKLKHTGQKSDCFSKTTFLVSSEIQDAHPKHINRFHRNLRPAGVHLNYD